MLSPFMTKLPWISTPLQVWSCCNGSGMVDVVICPYLVADGGPRGRSLSAAGGHIALTAEGDVVGARCVGDF